MVGAPANVPFSGEWSACNKCNISCIHICLWCIHFSTFVCETLFYIYKAVSQNRLWNNFVHYTVTHSYTHFFDWPHTRFMTCAKDWIYTFIALICTFIALLICVLYDYRDLSVIQLHTAVCNIIMLWFFCNTSVWYDRTDVFQTNHSMIILQTAVYNCITDRSLK